MKYFFHFKAHFHVHDTFHTSCPSLFAKKYKKITSRQCFQLKVLVAYPFMSSELIK